MAEKNLPIKFFQKREKDNMDTEGFGGGDLPSWALSGRDLYQRSMYVKTVLDTVSTRLSRKIERKNYLPSVVKVKLNNAATAKSYRSDVSSIFNAGKFNTIGVNGDDEILVKVDGLEDVRAIVRNLEKVESAFPSKSSIIGVSAITNVELYTPMIDVTQKEESVLKVKLFNYGNSELDSLLLKNFEAYCRTHNLQCKRGAYSGDLNIYRLDGVTTDVLRELEDFEGILSVTDMPFIDVASDVVELEESIAVKQPKQDVQYPVVGVLDTGIASIPHLQPWIENTNITYYQESDQNKAHGTFVAGILVYGDQLEEESFTGFDGCKLFEAIVLPDLKKQKVYESELIEQIRDAIHRNDHIKIWNLSLGSEREADLLDFSDFGKALDEMQEQYDVLICKSAGNCEKFKINAPKERITRSADSVRSLVVGSLGHDRLPSAFSRMGPGPFHLIKPDVVHIGGAAIMDARGKLNLTPVKSFSPSGTITSRVGTSFSTPRVTAIAAGLNSLLNESFNPLLLKALIVHSARYPEEIKSSMPEKLLHTGFGLPKSIQEIVFNQPNEITLILQDTIEKGTFIDMLDFPFPESMVDDDGYYYGEVAVTLVNAPILDPSQGAEYCQSNVDVLFGSYDEKVDRDITQRGIKNPIGADGRANLLATALYSKVSTRDTETAFAGERMLVSYGDKYQPVKKWSVNFDEFTPTNKEKYLKSPKNWYLKLKGLFRHQTEARCEMQNITPSQEFCLIITIKDTKKRGNIYNEATQLLNRFGFIHSNVKVNEEVRIRLSGNG